MLKVYQGVALNELGLKRVPERKKIVETDKHSQLTERISDPGMMYWGQVQ